MLIQCTLITVAATSFAFCLSRQDLDLCMQIAGEAKPSPWKSKIKPLGHSHDQIASRWNFWKPDTGLTVDVVFVFEGREQCSASGTVLQANGDLQVQTFGHHRPTGASKGPAVLLKEIESVASCEAVCFKRSWCTSPRSLRFSDPVGNGTLRLEARLIRDRHDRWHQLLHGGRGLCQLLRGRADYAGPHGRWREDGNATTGTWSEAWNTWNTA